VRKKNNNNNHVVVTSSPWYEFRSFGWRRGKKKKEKGKRLETHKPYACIINIIIIIVVMPHHHDIIHAVNVHPRTNTQLVRAQSSYFDLVRSVFFPLPVTFAKCVTYTTTACGHAIRRRCRCAHVKAKNFLCTVILSLLPLFCARYRVFVIFNGDINFFLFLRPPFTCLWRVLEIRRAVISLRLT
jgi:hypothetical protein